VNDTRQRTLSLIVNALAVALLLPIVVVIVISFSGNGYMRFPPDSLSLQWYAKIFTNAAWKRAAGLSTVVALLSTVVTVLVAGSAAYGLSRGRFRAKNLALSFLLLPMIAPTVVAAVGMYFISLRLDLVGNVLWVAVCHATVCVPAVLLILLTTFHGIDVNLERAAFSLGCSRLEVFRRVVIPLALPGLVSASFVAFLGSFDEFIISLFLMGTKEVLPVRIYNSIFLEIEPTIAAVSTLIIALSAALMLLDWINRRRHVSLSRRLAG
jgi:putative spermidine/putrescine transport system permease protein